MWDHDVSGRMTKSARRKMFKMLLAVVAAVWLEPGLVTAQQVDCLIPGRNTPATPVPECVDSLGFSEDCTATSIRLWPNDFHPTDGRFLPITRDSTDRFAGKTIPGSKSGHELFSGVDIVTVGGVSRRLYASYNAGLQVWGIESDPGNPNRLDIADGWEGQFISFPRPDEVLSFVLDIAALNVDSTTDVAAVAGKNPVGTSLWEFNTINRNLQRLYQDTGTDGRQVRMVETNSGIIYAFVGAANGLAVYNVNTARTLGTPCLDDQGSSCSTVYRGLVGTPGATTSTLFVDTLHIPGSGRIFAVSSGGLFVDLKLWQVNDPQNPGNAINRFTGLRHALGTALFTHNSHHYLAVVSEENGLNKEILRIFMIDGCVNGSGTCSIGPGSMEDAIIPISLQGFATAEDYLSYSEFDGDPYLYYGVGTGNLSGPDLEQLFDLSSLRPPNGSPLAGLPEITQTGQHYTDPCNQSQIGYWSHYYHANTQGLNNTVPRAGKFSSTGHFYRAAASILDVHVKGAGSGPVASGIETEVAVPQAEYWMSDEIAYQATPSGSCVPSSLSWLWTASSSRNDVVPAQVSQGTDQASYQFDCVVASGRCQNATATVTAGNGACPAPPTTLTASDIVVKDPAIAVVSTDTGGRSTFENCEDVPLSAELAGRAPAFWEWHVNGQPISGCSSNRQAGDLSTVDTACTLLGSSAAEGVFADGFESGSVLVWNSSKSGLGGHSPAESLPRVKMSEQVSVELRVWDSADKSLAPRETAPLNFELTETGTPAFSTPVPPVVNGSSATLDHPATSTTEWAWELEDPDGGATCGFPGKPSVACFKTTTTTSSLQHAWSAGGTYSYRVTATNCGTEQAVTTSTVTVDNAADPVIQSFRFKDNLLPSACCGDATAGFECQAGQAIEFEVNMTGSGSFTFGFDWDRPFDGAAEEYEVQPWTSQPDPTRWIFSHTFQNPSPNPPSVFPKVEVSGGGTLSDIARFQGTSIEITVGAPTCN